jgi:hypothetical protein
VSLSANSGGAYASPNFAGTIGEGIFSRLSGAQDIRADGNFDQRIGSSRVDRPKIGVSVSSAFCPSPSSVDFAGPAGLKELRSLRLD